MKKPPNVLKALDDLYGQSETPENLSKLDAEMFAGHTNTPDPSGEGFPRCETSGKICYPSANRARLVMRKRQKRGAAFLRCYKCPECSKFHLTSKR